MSEKEPEIIIEKADLSVNSTLVETENGDWAFLLDEKIKNSEKLTLGKNYKLVVITPKNSKGNSEI